MSAPNLYLDGSPIDRAVFLALLAAGLAVLVRRKDQVGPLLRQHGAILLFFAFAGFSVLWSAFPYVTFKHWWKGIGDVVMVLIVVTELQPKAALKRLLARTSFILIPLSLLFSKYYPELGRDLTRSWTTAYTGVTLSKNALGEISMIFGLGALWCFLDAWRNREDEYRVRRLIAHGTVLAVVLAIFGMVNSATSMSCFFMAGTVMVLASRQSMRNRNSSTIHFLVAAVIGFAVFTLIIDPGSGLLTILGRSPTLTGRTEIWHQVLTVAGNPWVGTGYASFWLGSRLQEIWSLRGGTGLQESHNGYLEIYLNLGWIGVAFFAGIMATGYRKVIALIRANPTAGCLSIGWFVGGSIYSLTEDGFRMMTPLWIFFLLAIMRIPETAASEVPLESNLDSDDSLPESEPALDPALGFRFLEENR
ncbi:MAG: O-antigen ligase family protein [Terriglobia bacterium]